MSDDAIPLPPAEVVDPELVAALDALLFASGEPVTVPALAEALGRGNDEVRSGLHALHHRRKEGGIVLERIGGGWQLRTAPRFARPIHALLGTRPQKLSRPALEVLALVAYHQPIAKTEVDRIRGVDSGGVVKSLLDRGLVKTAGRSDDPGRPLLYRTTSAFLELFSLPDLAALPTLAEREGLVRSAPRPGHPDAPRPLPTVLELPLAPRIELVDADDDDG
ncbi:MAG: SMC-Scp complex subunit ScpB [Myxococcota bacterium]